jgi:predicted MFS family arabinose efflux permease
MLHRSIFSRFQRISFLRMTLLSLGLLDELIVGFALEGGLPLLRDQLGLSYEQVGLLFSVGALSALILEPIFNLLSDRYSKRWWILGGLLGLASGYALAGSTHNFIVLLIAFALTYPASGMAVGLSEAALIDDAPHAATRTMTHWTLICSIGDLLSPLVVAAFVALGFGWSALCWFAVIAWIVAGLIVWPQKFPRPASLSDDDDTPADVSILAGLRKALRDPLLLRWAALSLLPTMLDEVFTGFSVLYLRDVLHISQELISICIIVQMVGALLGLLIVNRLIGRIAPQRLLKWLALLSLIGVIGLLSMRSILLVILALFIISLGAAGLYPIAQAEAYARQPGRSGTVRAIMGLGMPFEIALPGIVGLVASRFGVLAGVGLLGTAPLLILLLAPWRTQE